MSLYPIFQWTAIFLFSAAYVLGLRRGIYSGNLPLGMLSIFVFFPVIIFLTYIHPLGFLRALPLGG